jgi:heat-inducible transcriptional repressor
LAERYSFELSPASIRKVLHELEELGLLRQAHASAGRTPTEEGFRVYADDILEVKKLPASMRAQIKKELTSTDFSPEKLFTICSKVLSNLTSHMGVVMAPGLSSLGLKKLYFVRISTCQILSVLMTQNGIIQNKLITTAEDFSQEALNEVNFFLEEDIKAPFTLDEIRAQLLRDMGENRTEFEKIFRRAFILASEIRESDSPYPDESRDIYMDEEGGLRLIEHPDFKDAEAMRGLFRTFENKRRLVDLLNEITGAGKVRVVIGPSGDESDGLTLVASPYLSGNAKGGALGILGPRRLNYSEIVPVVDYAAQVLSGLFSK